MCEFCDASLPVEAVYSHKLLLHGQKKSTKACFKILRAMDGEFKFPSKMFEFCFAKLPVGAVYSHKLLLHGKQKSMKQRFMLFCYLLLLPSKCCRWLVCAVQVQAVYKIQCCYLFNAIIQQLHRQPGESCCHYVFRANRAQHEACVSFF